MILTNNNVRLGDVFKVSWKEREWGDMKDWAFEGILLVAERKGETILYDIYWGLDYDGSTGKKFTIDQANELFNIEFYFNFDQVEDKQRDKDVYKYFDDEDIFVIHIQHSCSENCRCYYLKKGAVKSKAKMIKSIKESIEESERIIDRANNNIRYRNEQLAKVESGDLEVYI